MSRFRKGNRFQAASEPPQSVSIRSAIREFLASYGRKGSTPRTVEELHSYLVGCGRRSKWLPLQPWGEKHRLRNVADLTRERLEAYLDATRAGDESRRYADDLFQGLLHRASILEILGRRWPTAVYSARYCSSKAVEVGG
jgi:hypothetical protein